MKRLEKDLREWWADPRTDGREESYKVIRKQLASNHPRRAAVAAGRLSSLANWHGNHGSLAILDGQAEGWADIDRVLHYHWWDMRIDTSMTTASAAALTIAHAMAFEEESMAEWLAERLIQSLDEENTFLGGSWKLAPFGAFLLRLWAMYRGLRESYVARPHVAALGIYQSVLDAWSHPDQLRSALGAACDYHLAESRKVSGYPPFVYSPYQMFPVDMLAIAIVRRSQGLEMPTVEHPLLSTPLAKLPPREQRPRMGRPDPLLEQVIQKARDTGFL